MGKKKRSGKPTAKPTAKPAEVSASKGASKPSPKSPTKPVSGVSKLLGLEWVQVGLICLAAFLLRLWNVLEMRANSPFFDMPSTDSQHFDQLAQAIAAGDWLGSEVFYYNPVYPYFLGIVYTLFGHSYLAAKLIQITIGSLSCALVYVIAKRLTSRPAALLAAAMAAVYALFIFHEELLLTAVLSIFAMLLSVLTLLRFVEKPTYFRGIAAGAALGFAFVARPTFFPIIAAGWLFAMLWKRGVPFFLPRLAAVGVTAALMVAPVTLRNYVVGDDVVLISSHAGYNVYLGNNPESSGYLNMPKSIPRTLIDNPVDQKKWFKETAEAEVGRELKPSEVSGYWRHKGTEYILNNPIEWSGKVWERLVRIVNEFEFCDNQSFYFSKQFSTVLRLPLLGFGMVLPFALLGMIIAAKTFKRYSLIYLFVIGYTIGLLGFFIKARYRMLMVPFLIIFAAHAALWLITKLRERELVSVGKAAVALVVFFAMAHVDIGKGDAKGAHYIDFYNLGNKYNGKKDFDAAIDAYRKSIAMNRNYLSSHNNLASALEKSGRYEEALDVWRQVLTLAKAKGSTVHVERATRRIETIGRALGAPSKKQNKP